MKKLFILLAALALAPQTITAAVFSVEADVGRNSVNALEGILVLPDGVIPTKIYTGDSAVLIWIKKPEYEAATRSIAFAGLTPGGFSGRRAVFALEAASIDGASVMEGKAYLNDGKGTEASVKYSFSNKELSEDSQRPEPFTIVTFSFKDVFEGNYFITFAAQDKNTGIARYEFSSTWLFSPNDDVWQKTASPRELSFKEKFQRLHVRAVDQSGNDRKVSTGGPYWFVTLAFGLIILSCLALTITRFLSSRS